MAEKDPKNSVPEEQFGNTENTNMMNNDIDSEKSEETKSAESTDAIDPNDQTDAKEETAKSAESQLSFENKPDKVEEVKSETPQEPKTDEVEKPNIGKIQEEEEKALTADQSKPDSQEADSSSTKEQSADGTPTAETESEHNIVDEKAPSPKAESEQTTPEEKSTEKEVDNDPVPEDIDFNNKSKEELLDLLKVFLSSYGIEKIKKQVDTIKSVFYKIHNAELEEKRKSFIEEGGLERDFKVEESPVELTMKELLNEYRDKRTAFNKGLEGQKESNLKAKYEIIGAIKELINSQESLNKTFHDFRSLQEKWREIGPVPQSNVKDLWEKYHYHVEAFYDYIKINKELRDLDFKKNLEAKIKLCEKAEELLLEPSVVEAFRKLQVLHDQWREIGPVPSDKRSELWDRFKEATSKINHKHQEYFVKLKDEQKKNLQEKTLLCEKAEELAATTPENAKIWEEKSRELIDLQKIWKTIGFAPKKHNTKIYERFRAACDEFFNKKREFFAHNREEQENNLQLKSELCIQAEALADSTDWKKTTDELIKLQKRWKTIGPVPLKQSDKVWKRFRAACDKFFNNKSDFYANIDSTYADNLKLKEALLKEIEEFKGVEDLQENLKRLKSFQRRWSEIGFVPIKDKNTIQEKYRKAINDKFDGLKLDEEHKSLLKFRNKIESIAAKPNADRRISMEREKCYNRLKQLESDIALWENNIGFFSNSKNAESMISDIERKIEQAKLRMESLNEKLNILDDYD